MTRILALDTSTDACSVALLNHGEVIEKLSLEPRSHARLGLPMVDDVLREAGLRLADLDALAFARGPGSFTGLRIAAGLVQGLAFATGLPVVPVSTLQAMAFGYWHGCAPEHRPQQVLALLDARMNEVYAGLFEMGECPPQILSGEKVLPPPELAKLFAASEDNAADNQSDLSLLPFHGIGSGLAYRDDFPSSVSQQMIHHDQSVYPQAAAVAWIAEALYDAGMTVSAAEAQPVYIRDEVTWKKLPGR